MEKNEEAKEGTTLYWKNWADFYKHANQPGEYYRCVCADGECSSLLFMTF